ncbi:MAG: RNA-binding cell elongation regulator Jag/EloR [Oscillospiraceae bacterium]
MREVISTGKTVEEAVEKGCQELGLSRDDVSVEILDLPVKRLFKSVPAKVRVSADDVEHEVAAEKPVVEKKVPAEKQELPEQKKKDVVQAEAAPKATSFFTEPEEPIEVAPNSGVSRAVSYVSGILDAAGVEQHQIHAFKQGDSTLLRIESDTVSQYLEIRGDTIQALSYLTERAVNKGIDKKDPEFVRLRLDVEGYRNRREAELTELARQVAKDVLKNNRHRTLQPMNAYERLIVHTTISEIDGLESESTGADTERQVVIKSTDPSATDGGEWKAKREYKGGGKKPRDGRGGHSGSRPGGSSRRGPSRGRNFQDKPRTSTPEREFANKERNANAQPVVPKQREAITDGQDLPLYGKIEL